MEIIAEIIAYELRKYEKDNNIVDIGFIKKVVEVFIKYYKIEDFVISCEINNNLGDQKLSGYNIKDKKIYIGYDEEITYGKTQLINNGISLNNESKNMFINYRLIGAIIHELTHALQYYKCLNNYHDFETLLLKYGLDKNIILLKNNEKLDNISNNLLRYLLAIDSIENNQMYYLTVPHERMANITGNTYEEEICKYFNKEKYHKLNETIKLKNLTHKLLTYDKCTPTALIINSIENIKKDCGMATKFKSFEEIISFLINESIKNKYNINDRLYYGLPISEDEYKLLYQKKRSLEKKII